MTTPRTSNGRTITDAEIDALADEAERGYDPAELIVGGDGFDERYDPAGAWQ